MFQRDFLMRELKRILDGITAALGKSKQGETSLALDTLGALHDDLLGEHRALLDHTDARTMATLLGTKERIAAVAHVLAAEASVFDDAGRGADALMRRARATELMLEAEALGYDDEDVIDAWAVPSALLSARARELKGS